MNLQHKIFLVAFIYAQLTHELTETVVIYFTFYQ